MLRKNGIIAKKLGPTGVWFLEYAAGAIQRILPHVELSTWKQNEWKRPECVFTSDKRNKIRITLAIGMQSAGDARSLTTYVTRRSLPLAGVGVGMSLHIREHDICKRIVERIGEVFENLALEEGKILADTMGISLEAMASSFDEYVISSHIEHHHNLKLSVSKVLSALHTLSEQSYENKALTFGCVLDPKKKAPNGKALFPQNYMQSKKYKALSDGFRTAYHISIDGKIIEFLDLDSHKGPDVSEKHYFPEWAKPIARVSRDKKCGIALSRQGDILIFDEGTLRFTYRYGKWQYWNHSHVINLIKDRIRAQHVQVSSIGSVIGPIYRAALDVSFRRSGGLFVILHNQNNLHQIVPIGDSLADFDKPDSDREFELLFKGRKLHSIPRSIMVELASLDGAVVVANSGKLLAYASVLQPKRSGHLKGSEGSRTKAAIGASHYGVAVKISSDGEIAIYHAGKPFIAM